MNEDKTEFIIVGNKGVARRMNGLHNINIDEKKITVFVPV